MLANIVNTNEIVRMERIDYRGKYKLFHVNKIAIYPIADISHKNPMGFKHDICDYTPEGRKYIHDAIGI